MVTVLFVIITIPHFPRSYLITEFVTSEAGTAYPSGAHDFTPGLQWVGVA